MQNRISKSAFNLLFAEMQKIRERVFNGIPEEIRKEMKEELKELRAEMSKENGGTRKIVVGILVAVVLCFATIIVQDRFASRSQAEKIDEIKSSLMEHRSNEVPN